MKSDLLLALSKKYNRKTKKISYDLISKLMKVNDEVLSLIINSKIKQDTLERLVKNDNFILAKIPNQKLVIESLSAMATNEDIIFFEEYVLTVLESNELRNSDKLKDILSAYKDGRSANILHNIFINFKGKDLSSDDYVKILNYVLDNNDINNSFYFEKLVKEMPNKYFNIKYLFEILNLLKKELSDAKKEFICRVAINETLLIKNISFDICKIISNAKNDSLDPIIESLLENKNVLASNNTKDIVEIVYRSKTLNNVQDILGLFDKPTIVRRDCFLEVLEMIATSDFSNYLKYVFFTFAHLKKEYVLELMKLFYENNNARYMEVATRLIMNKKETPIETIINKVRDIFSIKDYENLGIIEKMIQYEQSLGFEVTNWIGAIGQAKFPVETYEIVKTFGMQHKEDKLSNILESLKNIKEHKKILLVTRLLKRDRKKEFQIQIDDKILEIINMIVILDIKSAEILVDIIEEIDINLIGNLIDILNGNINVNNLPAIKSLISSRDYELSSNPMESLRRVLQDNNNYEPFEEVYKDSDVKAIKGVKELDKEFPGIDINDRTYIKTKKFKNTNNK